MKREVILAAAAAVFACAGGAAIACDFVHGNAEEGFGKHMNNIGTGGEVNLANMPPQAWNMQFLSQVTLSQMAAAQGLSATLSVAGSSMWGWVDPLTHREYAIIGRNRGTTFVDISNPKSPVIVASLANASSTATSWREPKVVGNRAFIGVDGTTHGVQAVNLELLRNYAGTPLTLTTTSAGQGGIYNGVTREHTLAINATGGVAQTSPDGKKYVFVAGSNLQSGGIHAIDVTSYVDNPNTATMTFAGGHSADGYTHEMQVLTYNGPDRAFRGKEIALAFNGKSGTSIDTFSIVDVTNKSAMSRISSATYPQAGYIHQGWITPDHRYVIQNDELDETGGLTGGVTRTHFWDISSLSNPVYKGFYAHPGTSVDHNLYVKGDLVYMSNYTMGLRVFRLNDLASANPNDWLAPVAFFDTYAANDNATFNGAWNNYPFFPSGTIAISDINGGLILTKLDLPKKFLGELSPETLNLMQTEFRNAMARAAVPEPASLGLLIPAAAMLLRRRG
jgi:choice-of-anchor B domain-containing protein